MDVWNMPSIFGQVASWHENPEQAEEPSKELTVIDFANTLVNLSGFSQGDPELVNINNHRATKALALEPEQVNQIRNLVRKTMENRAFS